MLKNAAVAVVDNLANRDGIRVSAITQVTANDGLGQNQQFVVVRQPGAGTRAGAHDAQAARPVADDQPVLHPAPLVAQQQEIPVPQPAQQRRDLLAVRRCIVAARIAVDSCGQFAQSGEQRCRIGGDPLEIGQDLGQQPFDLGEGLAIDWGQELDVYPGLADVWRRAVRFRFDTEQLSRRAATHLEHRGHDGRVADPKPVQQHRHGIHQHAAVVGDHLQRRSEAGWIVCRVDGNTAFTRRTALAKPIVRAQHGRRHQRCGDGPTGPTGVWGFRLAGVWAAIAVDVGLRDPVGNVRTLGERSPRLHKLPSSGVDRHADCSQLTTETARLNRPAPQRPFRPHRRG